MKFHPSLSLSSSCPATPSSPFSSRDITFYKYSLVKCRQRFPAVKICYAIHTHTHTYKKKELRRASCNFCRYMEHPTNSLPLSPSRFFSLRNYITLCENARNRILPTVVLVDGSLHMYIWVYVNMYIYVYTYIHMRIYIHKALLRERRRRLRRGKGEQGGGLLPRYLEFDYPIRPMAFPPSSGHD